MEIVEKIYYTHDLAIAAGCHVNTVMRFEEQGFISRVPRNPRNNYREFTERHLQEMILARLALVYPYPGGKQTILDLVKYAVEGNLPEAMVYANQYLSHVHAEQEQAQKAIEFVEQWLDGELSDALLQPLSISKTSKYLNTTNDRIRNWERNGLIAVPRNPNNGYREYGLEEIGRLRVIRMLCEAGYSLAAILRLLTHLDQGGRAVAQTLDSVSPDEDFFHIADVWLSTLATEKKRAHQIIDHLKRMMEMNFA